MLVRVWMIIMRMAERFTDAILHNLIADAARAPVMLRDQNKTRRDV